LLGGVLALAAVLLLSPVWERQLLPDRLADLLAAYREYLMAVRDASAGRQRMQSTRAAARRARSNAQASLDRARAEPVRGRSQVELGDAVLAHTHRFIHAMLIIDAVRSAVHEAESLPEFDELMALAANALECSERSIRSGQPPRSVSPLRPAQERLAAALRSDPARVGGVETASALIDATDRVTNSLDTLVSELRRQLETRPALTSHG
jgi:uncharacterized membrane protein YccC